MNPCKTLIRASLSCLEFRAWPPNSAGLSVRHCSVCVINHSGLRLKTQKPFSISRSISCVSRAVPVETSNFTEDTIPKILTVESPEIACLDYVKELLDSEDKDDVSRIMKMERLPENDNEVRDHPKKDHWFPYLDKCKVDDTYLNSDEVLEAIGPSIMDSRKEKFRNTVNNRSYSLCLVVEGLSDFGNVSAAFRSADALGVQSVHVVSKERSRRYKDNRLVSMGSEKWLDIELWSSVRECFGILKSRGYRIATSHLGEDAVSIYDIDWSIPTAIVVGNEKRGICKEALELSDIHCSIPMRGMVDSFNVSVAAGVLMHHAVYDRILRLGYHADLTPEERQILLAEFYLRHSKSAFNVANEFSKRKSASLVSKL